MEIFNIIIPSKNVDKDLLRCVKSCISINYDSYCITVVLDEFKNSKSLIELKDRFDKDLFILKSPNKNISSKRNYAAKQSKSNYLAFIDSDAIPSKDWLSKAEKAFDQNKNLKLIGGPSGIPLDEQTFVQNVVNLSKRSFLCTGNFSKNKYSNKHNNNKIVESCNMFVQRNAFMSVGGMNEKIYIAEDFNLCKKIIKKFGYSSIKFVFDILIKHEDRNFVNFNLQRFSFGINFLITVKELSLVPKILTVLPLVFSILSILLVFISFKNLFFIFFIILLTSVYIYFELSVFKKSIQTTTLAVFFVLFANLSFVIGNIFQIIGLRKKLQRKAYLSSKSK